MTNTTRHVPEPEQQKKDDADQATLNVQIPGSSSEDDSDNENEHNMLGYQPLTLSENDAGASEFHAEPLDSSDEETEEKITDLDTKDEKREIVVNEELVRNAMKEVTLPGSSIPSWAKELSDGEWNALIKRTIDGKKDGGNASDSNLQLTEKINQS